MSKGKKRFDEVAYETGRRSGLLTVLGTCLHALGRTESPEIEMAKMTSEREEAIQSLRILGDRVGISDWSADDHLSDIIDRIAKGI